MISEKLSIIFCLVVSICLIAGFASAKAKSSSKCPGAYLESEASQACPSCPDDDEDCEEEEDEDYGEPTESYKRLHYSFGACGSYVVRKADVDIKGNVGVYSSMEYRVAKILSFGFDSYYGWLAGSGTQYWSSFNPGIKIFPMMYKNPRFEPYLFVGGHAFDGVYGNSNVGTVGMGQGGFAGAGFRWMPESAVIGLEFFVRTSFLYMEREEPVGGRGLIIPIFSMVGIVY